MNVRNSLAPALALAALAGSVSAAPVVTNHFDADPNWDAVNNRTAPQNFGFTNSNLAGASAGEIGGFYARHPTAAFYAHNFGPGLSFNDTLFAAGNMKVISIPDGSGMTIGWFDSATFHYSSSRNVLGLEILDGGVYITVADGTTPGFPNEIATGVSSTSLTNFSLAYNPNLGSFGRVTFVGNGTTVVSYDLTAAERGNGAQFNHFGTFDITLLGQTTELYFDDLIYSIPEPSCLALLALGGVLLRWRR